MTPPALGLRANAAQFALLVVVNAFVGAMVGLERSVLPALAEEVFHLAAKVGVLSFILVFGVTKALANYAAGRLGDTWGRKRVLVAGWLVAAPVPLLLMAAPSWGWVLAANALLGVSQGLTWSTAVIMKIDLAGPKQRGLAMGLNEFAGYFAVALSALASGLVAARWGLHPAPFALGLVYVAAGLGLSALLVRDTREHAELEAELGPRLAPERTPERTPALGPELAPTTPQGTPPQGTPPQGTPPQGTPPGLFWRVTLWDRNLSAATQAGLVNNLNDGLAWGLFPLVFAAAGLDLTQIGALVALYPAVWGLGQLGTGALSDRVGRKGLIVWGMVVQALGLVAVAAGNSVGAFAAGQALLGLGTAMVYPTLLAAIGDVAHPRWRGEAVGVYRLWRDLGYAFGALLAGLVADALGVEAAIAAVAGLTAASGAVVWARMRPGGGPPGVGGGDPTLDLPAPPGPHTPQHSAV